MITLSKTRLGLCRLAAVALVAAAAGPHKATAADVTTIVGGFSFNTTVTSIREARYNAVVPQQYDFSCGSASVATLLTYHYGVPTTEQAVFEHMWENGDQEAIRTRGFSMLDMKTYLATIGLESDGFEASLDQLVEVGIPGVTLINLNGYLHFVVIKGVTENEVLVGDPAFGMKIIPRDQFEAMWNGILFVVTNAMESGQQRFNVAADWRIRALAPLGSALTVQNLSDITLLMPGLNEFTF